MDRLKVFSQKLGMPVPVSNTGAAIQNSFASSSLGNINYTDWVDNGWNNSAESWLDHGWNNRADSWMDQGWNNRG